MVFSLLHATGAFMGIGPLLALAAGWLIRRLVLAIWPNSCYFSFVRYSTLPTARILFSFGKILCSTFVLLFAVENSRTQRSKPLERHNLLQQTARSHA